MQHASGKVCTESIRKKSQICDVMEPRAIAPHLRTSRINSTVTLIYDSIAFDAFVFAFFFLHCHHPTTCPLPSTPFQ